MVACPEGRYAWTAKVGEKGQIVIPKEAREVFGIKPGDTLLLHRGSREQAFVVERTAQEPSYVVARLHPAGESAKTAQFLGPDSKTTVYLYTHSVKLRDLVFKKL